MSCVFEVVRESLDLIISGAKIAKFISWGFGVLGFWGLGGLSAKGLLR